MAVTYSNYPAFTGARDKEIRLAQEEMTLGKQMDAIAARYGEDSKQFRNVKKAFDATQAEHTAAKAELTKIKAEIDAAEQKKVDAAQKKKDNESARAETLRLEAERDAANRRNDTAAAQAAQDKIDALKPKAQPEATPDANAGKQTESQVYAAYTLNADGTVTQAATSGSTQVYLVTAANGEQKAFDTLVKARDTFLANYATPEKLKQLQDQLLARHIIKPSQVADGTWVGGVDYLINRYTYQTVSDVKYGGKTETPSITDYIKSVPAPSGSGTPSRTQEITTRADAAKDLDMYMMDLRGGKATPQEQDAYYAALHAAEQKSYATTKDGVTTGQVLQDSERALIAASIASKSIKNMDPDALLASAQGSRAATDIADLQAYASDYGVEMSAADALKYVAAGLGQKDYIAKQKERIRQLSMTLHPYLKEHIAAGGSVADVADQFGRAKLNKLGVPVKTSTKDSDVMSAIARGISIDQFNQELQSKPEWGFTEEAHRAAADFISTIGRMWGRG